MTWDLQKAADCRLEAAELQRQAKRAWLPSNRRFYLEMADNFLRLAERYEMQVILKRTWSQADQDGSAMPEDEAAKAA